MGCAPIQKGGGHDFRKQHKGSVVLRRGGHRRRCSFHSTRCGQFGACEGRGAAGSTDGSWLQLTATMTDSRKDKNDVGIRGHGFVRDGDVFTTIDAPGAGLYTIAFGIDEQRQDRGRLRR